MERAGCAQALWGPGGGLDDDDIAVLFTLGDGSNWLIGTGLSGTVSLTVVALSLVSANSGIAHFFGARAVSAMFSGAPAARHGQDT